MTRKTPGLLQVRLAKQKALFGILQSQPSAVFADLSGVTGYDFLMMDGEHGLFVDNDYVATMRATSQTGMLAIVRTPSHDPGNIGRYLDIGVHAIVVPNVSTAEQAEDLVKAMEYPPVGTRGVAAGLHRVTRYGLDFARYSDDPRGGAGLIVMIESRLGVANVHAIASVQGVDGLLVGIGDLSADLGRFGDYASARYQEALVEVERACLGKGKVLVGMPHPGRPPEALLERGYHLIILAADIPLMREALASAIAKAHALL